MSQAKSSLAHVEQEGPACDAALRRAFDLLGKRWSGLVIGVLGRGPLGFAELRRGIGPITDSVLSDRLAELAEAGLVERSGTETRPPGVRYGLTPAGKALLPILEAVAAWSADHLG